MENYKEGLLLKGDTDLYEEELKKIHGKPHSKTGGWVFSLKRKKAVKNFILTKTGENKLIFNEEMGVLIYDKGYDFIVFLFHPNLEEAFASMDDKKNISPLDKMDVEFLEDRFYTVMPEKERVKYLKDYLEKNASLTDKLIEHPKLKGYMILEKQHYLFTNDKVAFCRLKVDKCTSLVRKDGDWLKNHGFEYLSSRRERKKEMHKVDELLEKFNDSNSDSEIDASE